MAAYGSLLLRRISVRLCHVVGLGAALLAVSGCGAVREHRATAQLLLSDAVDRSVANIDFTPLAHETVFLDTRFVQAKSTSEVTTNYVISSLRQQMVVAGCLLQDRAEDADFVVEARIGTMGSDGYDINYGVPPSTAVSSAASLVSSAQIPMLPEISIAKRTEDMAAVKIAVFAYRRETKQPVWQSGTSIAKSEASGTWVLGAGPFKRGSIYEGTQFVGNKSIHLPKLGDDDLSGQDYTYRDKNTWDPEIREKVRRGDHLGGLEEPDFAGAGSPRIARLEVEVESDTVETAEAVESAEDASDSAATAPD